LAKLARALGKNASLLERWSVRYQWQDRVQSFDRVMYDYYSRLIQRQRKGCYDIPATYKAALAATLQQFPR